MLETRKDSAFSFTRRRNFLLILTLSILSVGGLNSAAPLESTNPELMKREESLHLSLPTRKVEIESTRHEEKVLSSLPMKKAQAEDIGSPSELAWRAWLMVDGNPQNSGILDSASLLRRITPKSIFIAPALTACAEGYQADTMNRCVKDVSIDTQAHRGFLVERLNALFANVAKPQAAHSSSVQTGPLQLNIPLLMTNSKPDPPKAPENVENFSEAHQESTYEIEDSKEETLFLGSRKDGEILENNSKLPPARVDEDKTVFVSSDDNLGSVNSDDNSGSVVDYKVPTDGVYPASSNSSDDKNDEDVEKESQASPTLVLLLSPTRGPPESGNNDLIVPQNSSLGQAIVRIENKTGNLTGKEIIRVSVPETISYSTISTRIEGETTTDSILEAADMTVMPIREDSTIVDEIYDRVTDSTESYDDADENYEDSTEFDDEILRHSEAGIPVTLVSFHDKTSARPITETPSAANSSEKEPSEISSEVSINHDFVRETTLVDFTPRTENNTTVTTSTTEITHQEASADFSSSKELEQPESQLASSDELRNEKRDRPRVQDSLEFVERNETSSEDNARVDSKVEDVENSTRNKNAYLPPPSKKNSPSNNYENDSKVDSYVSSNIDVPRNPEKNSEIEIINENFEDESKNVYPVRGIEETFESSISADNSSVEKSDSGETMVAASTNVAGSMMSREETKILPPSEKLDEKPFGFSVDPTTTRIPPGPISAPSRLGGIYDEAPRDYTENRREPSDEPPPIIRTIEEQPFRSEINYDLLPTPNVEKLFSSSRQRDEGYVRFPNYEVRQENRVRFPSEEANSISNDYKERYNRPYGDHTYRDQQNNGANSLTDPSRKENYWWLPNDWRNGQADVFSHRSRTSADQRSRDRTPMLLRFWTRMPLVRDPSLPHPTRPSPVDRKSSNGHSRRANYHRESSQEVGRSFSRNRSAMGG